MTVLTGERVTDDRSSALAGVKGRSLYRLSAAGFAVPRWAILGTDAFEAALAASGVCASAAPMTLAERLREAAHAESVLRESPIAAAIKEDIAAAVDHVGAPRVAVRSSPRHDDESRHSYAGLFDSFLNLSGIEAVENAVRMCWASAFSPRVTHYRHVRGLGFGDVALAVIVQEFVEPVSSGVMFTVDPVGGSSDHILVNGVLGLGEGLVRGIVDADSVVVDKRTHQVLDETVVTKPFMVTTNASGGVGTKAVPEERQRESAVGPALREALVELAPRLERHLGGPQDVEWAYDGSTTWLLQTRPITTLSQEIGLAAEHLGEAVGPGELRIWDNSNIIESFSGVTSPLTFTVARQLYGDVYRSYARSLKVPRAQLEQMESWLPVMLGQFYGHVYYNLLHWYRMVGIAPGYTLNRRVLEIALGVSEPLDRVVANRLRPFVFRSPAARLVSRTRTALTYARRFVSIDSMVRDFDTTFAEFIARQGLSDVSSLDGARAYRHFRRTHTEVADIWGPMMVLDAILLTSVGLLAGLMKVFLPRAPEWVGFALLNPGVDIESVEPARALVAITEYVDTVPALRNFVDSVDPALAYPRLVEQAKTSDAPEWHRLLQKIDDYIDDFGYRCRDELKLEAPDLRHDPAGLFQMLRVQTADDNRRVNEQAEDYLDSHLHGPRRKVFDALRKKIQRAATHREHLRFCRTRGFGIIKSLAAVMGRDLEQRGIIDSRTDIFQLRLDELFGVYEGAMNCEQARTVVAKRKALEGSYRRFAAPVRFTTSGSRYTRRELELAGWRQRTDPEYLPTGAVLTGTPSSPGMVIGRVEVVEKPEEFSGGVLVAYRTEPSWAAALPFASALLIERASPLTHVAIIARELGIPTVVQIDGLTKALSTGMTVSVDGATGRVVVLEGQQSCRA
ncbi:phosphoenolpyruvate synthase [Mycobacterium sp. Marseille-P9652]|uniref:phosphoenolpyruvate synthase n=1 Tax=Mycobacterium sp. Marseille-P9652 TaxID=2654950 RepID=UPI0012E98CBA|nr:phosphoenolpyruvate synthase [Mycobacterium sp. Marseille-P9652]